MRTPSLSPRLRIAPTVASEDSEWAPRAAMAPALMYIFAAGAVLTLLSLAIARPGDGGGLQLAVTAVCACAMAAILLAGYDRLPEWSLAVMVAAGTVLVEWSIFASDDSTSAFAMFYFWLAIYAFSFFPTRVALGELALMGASYAAVLVITRDLDSPSVLRWVITTGSLIVAGAIIGVLRRRVHALVTALRQVARVDLDSGIPSRGSFEDHLAYELSAARRAHGTLSVMVGRLEGLDELRRRRGEAAAQRALRATADVFRGQLRATDSVARIDRTTFAIVAPFSDDHVGYVLAERLMNALAGADGAAHGLHARFGVASFPADGEDADGLVEAASRALDAAEDGTAPPVAKVSHAGAGRDAAAAPAG